MKIKIKKSSCPNRPKQRQPQIRLTTRKGKPVSFIITNKRALNNNERDKKMTNKEKLIEIIENANAEELNRIIDIINRLGLLEEMNQTYKKGANNE